MKRGRMLPMKDTFKDIGFNMRKNYHTILYYLIIEYVRSIILYFSFLLNEMGNII